MAPRSIAPGSLMAAGRRITRRLSGVLGGLHGMVGMGSRGRHAWGTPRGRWVAMGDHGPVVTVDGALTVTHLPEAGLDPDFLPSHKSVARSERGTHTDPAKVNQR